MYLGILAEQPYSATPWFNAMYDNLIKAARLKRISYKRYSIEELEQETEMIQHIVIIGTKSKWLDKAFEVCNKKQSNIIFYNNGIIINQDFNFNCNVVS